MPRPLVVVGSVNADLYVEVDRLPAPGETILGARAAVRPGGKGGNQAGACARLGATTHLIAQLGDDAFAPVLRAALADAGVRLEGVRTSPGDSGQAMILLQRGGENSIVVVPGANARWRTLDAAATRRIAGASALLLQREIPDAVGRAATAVARAHAVPVLLDPGGRDAPIPRAWLAQLSLLSPNETELARLTGLPTRTAGQAEAAARRLIAQGVGAVLVKRGAHGCLLIEGQGPAFHQPAWRVRVVDTTGAGDCCSAAYAVALTAGWPPQERLAFACAAAACCVQAKGALPAMPTRAQVARLRRRRP